MSRSIILYFDFFSNIGGKVQVYICFTGSTNK